MAETPLGTIVLPVGVRRRECRQCILGCIFGIGGSEARACREPDELLAPDRAAGDWFGKNVAIFDDNIVVGAQKDDDRGSNSGAAYMMRALQDCNANGVPDPDEQDCNANGVPDPDEQDCNGNGFPDDCDIANQGGGFGDAAAWATFDVKSSSPPGARGGYTGALHHDQFVYLIADYGEVLRYNTHAAFDSGAAWVGFDVASVANGWYSGAVSDGRYIYLVPAYDILHNSGEVVRYDPEGPLDDPSAWAAFNAHNPPVGAHGGYHNAIFDGRYVYFAPRNDRSSQQHGEVLRYDSLDDFQSASAWTTCDPGALGIGSDPDGYIGGVFDGRYVYFAPYNNGSGYHGEVLRFDTGGGFCDPASWIVHNVKSAPLGARGGYSGAVFDGSRYVYFVPLISGHGAFHGEVLRYDTGGSFTDPTSWDKFDSLVRTSVCAGV